MQQVIWKFPLRILDVQIVRMPAGAKILTAQVQYDELQLWAIVDPYAPIAERVFRIETTGREIAIGPTSYIATFQIRDGLFVGHLFEVTP